MPSFDIVSEVDSHEVSNAVDQANRELGKRYDFKGTQARFHLDRDTVTLRAPSEFQLKQMADILTMRLAARKVDLRCLKVDSPEVNVSEARQVITVRQGIETELARKIVKTIKNSKLKAQSAIQGDKVRVTGKKRDVLQDVITMLKDMDLDMPLQFDNYRD
ncbi:MAG: YajQ family cyclic di-GMP-binding protein [Acidobacteriota bacterium]